MKRTLTMEVLKEFLESSTIHGLNYISTAKVSFSLSLSFMSISVQFSADVYNHYDMKQRSIFIASLVVNSIESL